MSVSNPYSIAIEEEAFVVRFDRNFFSQDELSELLDYLRIKALRSRSQLADDQIAELADVVKRSGWKRIKDDFLAIDAQL
jgi:hypothetical protein